MRNQTAAVGRALTALLGVGLLIGGGSIVLWWMDVPLARRLYAHADRDWYRTAAEQSWWAWALALVAVFATVAGLLLLTANLRPNRLGAIELTTPPGESPTPGTAAVSAGVLANAVAAHLGNHPLITSATGRAVHDRGLRTLRITMRADPDVPLDQLRGLAANAVADIAAATDHTDLATQFFVHYQPANTETP
jgi:hypothetical protein